MALIMNQNVETTTTTPEPETTDFDVVFIDNVTYSFVTNFETTDGEFQDFTTVKNPDESESTTHRFPEKSTNTVILNPTTDSTQDFTRNGVLGTTDQILLALLTTNSVENSTFIV